MSRAARSPAAVDATGNVITVLAAARAVIVGFKLEVEAGTLRPPQHASLRLLEEAIAPFADSVPAPSPEAGTCRAADGAGDHAPCPGAGGSAAGEPSAPAA